MNNIFELVFDEIPPKNVDNVRQALVILLKNNPQVFKEGKMKQEKILEKDLPLNMIMSYMNLTTDSPEK